MVFFTELEEQIRGCTNEAGIGVQVGLQVRPIVQYGRDLKITQSATDPIEIGDGIAQPGIADTIHHAIPMTVGRS